MSSDTGLSQTLFFYNNPDMEGVLEQVIRLDHTIRQQTTRELLELSRVMSGDLSLQSTSAYEVALYGRLRRCGIGGSEDVIAQHLKDYHTYLQSALGNLSVQILRDV